MLLTQGLGSRARFLFSWAFTFPLPTCTKKAQVITSDLHIALNILSKTPTNIRQPARCHVIMSVYASAGCQRSGAPPRVGVLVLALPSIVCYRPSHTNLVLMHWFRSPNYLELDTNASQIVGGSGLRVVEVKPWPPPLNRGSSLENTIDVDEWWIMTAGNIPRLSWHPDIKLISDPGWRGNVRCLHWTRAETAPRDPPASRYNCHIKSDNISKYRGLGDDSFNK